MAQTTGRVLALLEMLQSGGTRTQHELARRLEVDRRTVRRYVAQLRELDIPVESVRGRYGGYRLDRHHRMPPLMLTDDEAVAVFWSLLTTARADAAPAAAAAFGSAMAKVRRVLPVALGRRVDAVRQTVSFADSPEAAPTAGAATVLLGVAAAVRDRQPIGFTYRSGDGRSSSRAVHPHGIVAHRGRLYLAAFDTDKRQQRTFRLDRVRDLHRLDGPSPVVPSPDPVDLVLGPLPPSTDRYEVSVRVAATVAQVRQFMPELLASVAPCDPPDGSDPGEWVRVVVRAERLEWVAQRLAAVDRPFAVERPAELNDAVAALADRLLARAEPDRSRPPR